MGKITLMVILILFLTACGQSDEVGSFMHVHGLEFDKEGNSFYLATHHGLIHVDESSWKQVGEETEHHDLMGFTILEDGKMISSGHPSYRSELENPLGVIVSQDEGETWEPIALHGKVDFHVLHVSRENEQIMYGIDSYHSELYRTADGGYEWQQVNVSGLPVPIGEVYALSSHPQKAELLLAGTGLGIFVSEDGGQNWEEYKTEIFSTAFQQVGQSGGLIAYLFGEKEGLYISEDFGNTWSSLNLQLDEDAVTYISVHPVFESEIIVGTSQQNIYRTINHGESWEVLASEGEPIKALQ
ncbi:F510_1955 family glycosylhydrolase [Halalkalibacter alkaliphilus]|uniref:Sortilin N-terminal domain-containing protein n=1 Tax=Halalkalibacter alkaliphilus TaxID=2917993 RepID=A0A9X2I7N0_9BACI|nr:hypothetical protein [Halalkalibacter alkaliphilus]MCL7748404.1 hypothetical protein [Halalkalibacter alkaliphilus]